MTRYMFHYVIIEDRIITSNEVNLLKHFYSHTSVLVVSCSRFDVQNYKREREHNTVRK